MSFRHLVFTKSVEPDGLALLSKAATMVEQAKTLDETQMLKTLFDFAQRQARQKHLEGMEKEIIEYRFMLKDKTGELIEEKIASGEVGRPGPQKIGTSKVPSLKEMGVSKNESSEAQRFHKLPEEKKRKEIDSVKAKVGIKSIRRKRQLLGKITGKPLAEDHFCNFIYCDCGKKYSLERAIEAGKR